MGLFTKPGRRATQVVRSGASAGSDAAVTVAAHSMPVHPVPAGYEAVAEALERGADVRPACAELGRRLARDGVDLHSALGSLRATYAAGAWHPDADAIETLAVRWGEETLSFVHQVSCEDPLTGLASLAHVRARLGEIYRGAEGGGRSVTSDYALLVIDLPDTRLDAFSAALKSTRIAELVRLVFSGEEPICQVAGRRLVAVCRRTERFGLHLGALKDLIDHTAGLGEPHVWVERLPAGVDAAAAVLDEVAR